MYCPKCRWPPAGGRRRKTIGWRWGIGFCWGWGGRQWLRYRHTDGWRCRQLQSASWGKSKLPELIIWAQICGWGPGSGRQVGDWLWAPGLLPICPSTYNVIWYKYSDIAYFIITTHVRIACLIRTIFAKKLQLAELSLPARIVVWVR